MIIDAQAELSDEFGAANLIRLMDLAKIDRAVISPAVTDPFPAFKDLTLKFMPALLRSPVRSIALSRLDRIARRGVLQLGDDTVRIRHVVSNDAAFDAAARSDGRLLPFAVVTPHTSRNTARQVEAWISERRISGAKAFGWYHALDPGRDLAAIGRLLERARLPLILQLGANARTSDFQALRFACPDLTVILSHAAMPAGRTAWEWVRKDPHLFIDLAGPWLDAATVQRAVRAVGPHKVVFASNAPNGLNANGGDGTPSYASALDRVNALRLRSSEIELILGGTMSQLLAAGGT